MTDDARVPVTQISRDAAADWTASIGGVWADAMRAGAVDEHDLVQAFARHHLAGREEAAKVCDDLATTAANIQAALELVGSEAPTKAIQRETAEALAAAIRQMGGE